jgi:hypothetical protein
MNSIYRYLTRITSCLGLWIMIFSGLGMGYDSASAELPSKVNSGQPADGGGKIIILKLTPESPQKPLQVSAGDIRTQQPPPAKMPLQFHRSSRVHQDASAKMTRKRSESKPAQQPDAKPQLSDVTAPINAQQQPEMEHIAETPAIQEPIITEALMPAGQTPLLTEKPRPEPLQADNAPPVSSKKDDDIQSTASKKRAPEYAPQQDSIHDTVGIIARLLLKFSMIIVCCIALYFSFTALQIAKTNQRIRYRVEKENGAL